MLDSLIIFGNDTDRARETSFGLSSRLPVGSLFGDLKMCTEKWQTIKGYEGVYEISNKGNVRNTKRNNKPHILALATDSSGRKTVSLWKHGKEKRYKVHRLVLSAFIGSCPATLETCHNDGNASNNCVSNLRWDTHISNCQDRKAHGRERGGFVKGNRAHCKINIRDVKEIRKLAKTQSQASIALKYPIGATQVNNILRGYSWKNV